VTARSYEAPPGALWFPCQQKFGHGLRVAWYRDIVRPRILSTPLVERATDKRCEIHVLTSKEDWLNLIWTLKSFYVASGRRYAFCIHQDGLVGNAKSACCRSTFRMPVSSGEMLADAKLAKILRNFSRSLFLPEYELARRLKSSRFCSLS
jgi:hypothetical protein